MCLNPWHFERFDPFLGSLKLPPLRAHSCPTRLRLPGGKFEDSAYVCYKCNLKQGPFLPENDQNMIFIKEEEIIDERQDVWGELRSVVRCEPQKLLREKSLRNLYSRQNIHGHQLHRVLAQSTYTCSGAKLNCELRRLSYR